MDRRRFLLTSMAGAFAVPPVVGAQQADKVARIGVLSFGAPEPFREGFRRALVDLGYVEGRNVVIEHRWADGQTDRLPTLAAALLRANMDLIVASATPSVQAAMEATRHIPIIMAAAGDALRTGLVTNLARPGGNVTGLSLALVELAGKTVELLRETLASRHAVRLRGAQRGSATSRVSRRGRVVGPETRLPVSAGHPGKRWRTRCCARLDRARSGWKALSSSPSSRWIRRSDRTLVRLTLKHRLPAVSGLRRFAEAGGLGRLCVGVQRSAEARGHLRRQDPQRRHTRRFARGAAHTFSTRLQLEDRQSARPHDPAVAAGAGGSGHRVNHRAVPAPVDPRPVPDPLHHIDDLGRYDTAARAAAAASRVGDAAPDRAGRLVELDAHI